MFSCLLFCKYHITSLLSCLMLTPIGNISYIHSWENRKRVHRALSENMPQIKEWYKLLTSVNAKLNYDTCMNRKCFSLAEISVYCHLGKKLKKRNQRWYLWIRLVKCNYWYLIVHWSFYWLPLYLAVIFSVIWTVLSYLENIQIWGSVDNTSLQL